MEIAIVIFGGCWTAIAGYLALRRLKKDFKEAGMEDTEE